MKNDGIPAREAWQIAVEKIFEGKPSSIAKGCPRNVFLYLVGANCKNGKNASYAREALDILDNMDEFDGIYQYSDFYKTPDNKWVLKEGITNNTRYTDADGLKPGVVKYKDQNGDGIK